MAEDDSHGDLDAVLASIRDCRACAESLPLGPRPVVRAAATARVAIVGQAPGTRVHATGLPWNDASGDRLRAWLDLDRATFYDPARIAIAPMGFCYPGRDPRGGDRPPRPECAPLWHAALWHALPAVETTLLVGGYAQRYYLGRQAGRSVQATVGAWRTHAPKLWPLPHPSWRNTAWLRRNPWFEVELLPSLRGHLHALLDAGAG